MFESFHAQRRTPSTVMPTCHEPKKASPVSNRHALTVHADTDKRMRHCDTVGHHPETRWLGSSWCDTRYKHAEHDGTCLEWLPLGIFALSVVSRTTGQKINPTPVEVSDAAGAVVSLVEISRLDSYGKSTARREKQMLTAEKFSKSAPQFRYRSVVAVPSNSLAEAGSAVGVDVIVECVFVQQVGVHMLVQKPLHVRSEPDLWE